MANEMVRFENAGLPVTDLGLHKRKAQELIQKARDRIQVGTRGLFLRLRKTDGAWIYGQDNTEIEEGALWAVNPYSLQTGYIAWPPEKSAAKQPIKKMRHIFDESSPDIDVDNLPPPSHGGVWDNCVAFQMQCIGGTLKDYDYEDVGKVLSYQQNSDGGKRGFDDLLTKLMKQMDDDPEHIVPVIELGVDSYQHPKWGTQYKPMFEVRKWISMEGPPTRGVPDEGDEDEQSAATEADEPTPEQVAAAAQAAEATRGRGRGRAAAAADAAPASGRGGRRGAAAQEDKTDGVIQRRRRR